MQLEHPAPPAECGAVAIRKYMQQTICKTCRELIRLHGDQWIHVGRSPAHPAVPSGPPPYRTIYKGTLQSALDFPVGRGWSTPQPAVRGGLVTPEQIIASLTAREIEVLGYIASGAPNKAVADTLCISIKTVEKHRSQIYNKTHIHCAVRLAHFCLAHGLVKNIFSIPEPATPSEPAKVAA
jgi:DNA-binding CsgD family transcriptional regulator